MIYLLYSLRCTEYISLETLSNKIFLLRLHLPMLNSLRLFLLRCSNFEWQWVSTNKKTHLSVILHAEHWLMISHHQLTDCLSCWEKAKLLFFTNNVKMRATYQRLLGNRLCIAQMNTQTMRIEKASTFFPTIFDVIQITQMLFHVLCSDTIKIERNSFQLN